MKKLTGIAVMVLYSIVLLGQEDVLTDGFVQFFYPNNQVSSEGTMKDGKPDGYWTTYYVTGIKKSEGKRTNFLLDSIWTFYNNEGDTIQTISYMFGKKNGYHMMYSYENRKDGWENGVIISKELFVNDKREGISYFYYPNGSLKSEVSYVNGKKQGIIRELLSRTGQYQAVDPFRDVLLFKSDAAYGVFLRHQPVEVRQILQLLLSL